MNRPLILASSSPRRKELLELIGIPFTLAASNADEDISGLPPSEMVVLLSERKAREIAEKLSHDAVVLGADTVVSVDGAILGKPSDESDAKNMLRLLQGRAHEVYTGIALVDSISGKCATRVEVTTVHFDVMSDAEIDEYIATGEPMDKAGAYGIQGKCAVYIKGVEGCFYNVMGLPLNALRRLLSEF